MIVFVLGFPVGLHDGVFPIWKRASIASEPRIDEGDLPKILIHTATREGMSGAPVFVIQRGVHRVRGDPARIIGHGQCFLGVYSNRRYGP